GWAMDTLTVSPGEAFKDIGSHDAVVLVHGTFARDADWTHDDSPIAIAIREQLPGTRVLAFPWSGANSPSARIKAGAELAQFGKSLAAGGVRDLWLVAHSHGGNVALFALRDEQFRSLVAGICFFGTPFFRLNTRSVERFSALVTQVASW